jgi:hypothetical protein
MATTFTPKQQQIRTALAGISESQFASLRAVLDALRVRIDARMAQLDAERANLVAHKTKLDAALTRFAKPKAFTDLRSALGKGQRLTVKPIKTPVVKRVVKPRRPGKKP